MFVTADAQRPQRDTGASSENFFEVLFTTDAAAAEELFWRCATRRSRRPVPARR